MNTLSVNIFLSYRNDAGQRPTAASSAKVAEKDATSNVKDLNILEPTQLFHNRHNDDDDDVARSVRFCRHISHSRGCR